MKITIFCGSGSIIEQGKSQAVTTQRDVTSEKDVKGFGWNPNVTNLLKEFGCFLNCHQRRHI